MSFIFAILVTSTCSLIILLILFMLIGSYKGILNTVHFKKWKKDYSLHGIRVFSKKYAKIYYDVCRDYNKKHNYAHATNPDVCAKAIKLAYKKGVNKNKYDLNCIFYDNIYFAYCDFEAFSNTFPGLNTSIVGYSIYEADNENCYMLLFTNKKDIK